MARAPSTRCDSQNDADVLSFENNFLKEVNYCSIVVSGFFVFLSFKLINQRLSSAKTKRTRLTDRFKGHRPSLRGETDRAACFDQSLPYPTLSSSLGNTPATTHSTASPLSPLAHSRHPHPHPPNHVTTCSIDVISTSLTLPCHDLPRYRNPTRFPIAL